MRPLTGDLKLQCGAFSSLDMLLILSSLRAHGPLNLFLRARLLATHLYATKH